MRSDSGPRPWMRRAFAGVLTAGLAAFVFWLVRSGDTLDQADKIASVVGSLAGVATLYLTLRPRDRAQGAEPSDVAGQLAQAERVRLASEQVFKQLQPSPLQVRWTSTRRPVAADPDVVLGLPETDWQQAELTGEGGDVVEAYRSLPHGRLVITGAAGAGKSVLATLLTLGLLDSRADGGPVPVLLSIASWHPGREGLTEFVIRRLEEEYELLGRGLARRLVSDGGVLPVLDGLDEMPEEPRKEALEAFDTGDVAGRPLVVTCRSEEYQDVVTARGTVLARAAVVELEPVGAEQVIAFLARDVPVRERWQPVFDRMRENPSGSLAIVLSTPLMAVLARTAHRSPAADPRDLLALTDVHAIADALIEKYVHSVYEEKPAQARRWLSCLAYQVFRAGTRELAWWELGPGLFTERPEARAARVRWAVLLTGAVVAAVIGWLLAGPGEAWTVRWNGELGTAPKAGLVALAVLWLGSSGAFRALWPGGYPPYVSLEYRSRARRSLTHVGFGAVFGLAVGALSGAVFGDLVLGMLAGCGHGLINAVLPDFSSRGLAVRSTPRTTLNVNRRNAVVAAGQHGLIAAGVFSAVALTVPWTWQVFPVAVLAAVVFGVGAALNAGLWTWTRFRLAHAGLAAVGWLPWRLFAFLGDALDRGVLRPAGTVWQFRHALVQDHLAHSAYRTAWGHDPDAGRREPEAQRQVQEDDLVGASRVRTLKRILAWKVAGTLAQGEVETAVPVLREQAAAAGDHLWRVAISRADQGDVRGAIAALGSFFADVHMTPWSSLFLTRARVPVPSAGPLVEQLRTLRDLRARARTGDLFAGQQLADLLVVLGQIDELEHRAAAGDWAAAARLAELRAEQGDLDGAVRILRVRAAAGDQHAALKAAELLSEHGRGEDAITILRAHGGLDGARAFYWLLAEHGHLDELRGHAEAGTWLAVEEMPVQLERFGHLDELRAQADAGNWRAAERYSRVLAEQGRFEELRTRAEAGDWYAGEWLAVREVPRPWPKSAPAPRRVVLPPVVPAEPEPERRPPPDESVLIGTLKLVWRLSPYNAVATSWFSFFAALAYGGAVGAVWASPGNAGVIGAGVLAGTALLWLLPLLRREPAVWADLTWRGAPKRVRVAVLALPLAGVPVVATAALVISALLGAEVPLGTVGLVVLPLAYVVIVLVALKIVAFQAARWRLSRDTSA